MWMRNLLKLINMWLFKSINAILNVILVPLTVITFLLFRSVELSKEWNIKLDKLKKGKK